MTRSKFTSEKGSYYPFGLTHKGYNHKHLIFWESPGTGIELVPVTPDLTDTYKYKFQGTELQEELGLNMYAMDFRQYDPAIARWVVQDPVTHHSMSPYVAYDNNPVFWADPSGADSESFIEEIFKRSTDGEIWTNNNDGTFTSSTGQTAECKGCAKGGHFDGKNLEDFLGIQDNSTIFTRKRTEGNLLAIGELSRHLDEYERHIEELRQLLQTASDGGLSISTIAFILKKRTAAGLITSLLVKIQSSNIPEDQKELLKVALRYAEMHSNDISKGQGVYMVKERSGNLWLPGSDKVIVNYYDKATGKYLGGIGRSSFGTVKQEEYKKD